MGFLSSAAVTGDTGFTAGIAFYINLGLALCVLISLTTLIVMFKKTMCARPFGIAGMVMFGVGLAAFVVQFWAYTSANAYAAYIVYSAFGLMYATFIVFGIYCCCLARNSHRALSFATGISMLVPPVGAALGIVLSYRIGHDTPIKKLVYSGYAYTYAELCAFASQNGGAELIDASDDIEYEKLKERQAKKKLRALKKQAKTEAGMFEYAAALIHYMPYKFNKAFKLMQKSAESGYAPALFNLGYYYETGRCVKRDIGKAREYYKRAADSGDADAEMRLIFLGVTSNDSDAFAKLEERAKTDLNAKYNLGVCYERAYGCEFDLDKAFDIYTECANAGMFVAQRRIFVAASVDMNSVDNGEAFNKITERKFEPEEFAKMIDGLKDIKARLPADASEKFLDVVKMHGSWEGVARCLVGTLYIDRGKLREDRVNGADYVRSALDIWDGASEVFEAIPKYGIKRKKTKQ